MQLFFDVDTLPDITFDFTFDTPLSAPGSKGQVDSILCPDASSSTVGPLFSGAAGTTTGNDSDTLNLRHAPPSPASNGTSEDDAAAASRSTKVFSHHLGFKRVS
jgi:hypothetical protein